MIRTYLECREWLGSDYAIRKKLDAGELYRVGWGLYSDKPSPGLPELAAKRYPATVVAMDSAFFYQGLTDVVPDRLHLATARDTTRIADRRIRQHFVPAAILGVGVAVIDWNGAPCRTYDLERLAIDAVRMRTKLPYELYKEVVLSLRARSAELYPAKIDDYLDAFPRRDSILASIEKEIF